VFDHHRQELKELLAAAPSVTIVTDEASDSQDRFGLHILYIPQMSNDSGDLTAYLGDIVYLDQVNGQTVSQAIIKSISSYNISYDNVSGFVTDNASYMSKAFDNLKALLPNAVHLTCNAHILSLAGETWRANFKNVDQLVAKFKAIFTYCSARKRRYKQFLAAKLNVDDVPLPPTPVVTRWNSWFQTVFHHAKYIDHYSDFVTAELQISESKALDELLTLLKDPRLHVVDDVNFIASNAGKLVEDLTWFESRDIHIHLAYNRLMDLLAWAETSSANTIKAEYKKVFDDMASKLCQYYKPSGRERFSQPALSFMKAIRVFDFKQIQLLTCDDSTLNVIHGLNDDINVKSQFAGYKAAAINVPAETSLPEFWFACRDRFPQLSSIALRYLSVPTNSVDAERSVSQYTNANAPQRQSLSADNLANQVIIAKNSKSMSQ